MDYSLSHIKELEAESIDVIREVAAQFEKPCILFSGGKDSILMTYLAVKAFYPQTVPFPLVHVDTGHNFPETIKFRDDLVERYGLKLIVGSVQEAIDSGFLIEEKGKNSSRNELQIPVLLETLEGNKFDAALGGGRRDEEKARAKERFFSHRDEFSQWDPKNQRPELWNLFNGRKRYGEHFRIFPLSNWTELDVWQYLGEEEVEIPSLYFAHEREVVERDGTLLAVSDYVDVGEDEEVFTRTVRCRTIGDMTSTGVWPSEADTIEAIIQEVATSRQTERGARTDDKRSETSMEDRKKEGYF